MTYTYTEKQLQASELRKKGKTFAAIAKEMGITPSGARGHFVSYKRKERHNTIIQEVRSGISVEIIAQKYGYPISTFQSIVRDA